MIYTFFVAKMSKFSKKRNCYKRLILVPCQEPLERVGLYVTCFDIQLPIAPITVCISFQDAATGHIPEDGEIDGYALAEALAGYGLMYIDATTDPSSM
jgi:hypothetical protein